MKEVSTKQEENQIEKKTKGKKGNGTHVLQIQENKSYERSFNKTRRKKNTQGKGVGHKAKAHTFSVICLYCFCKIYTMRKITWIIYIFVFYTYT